MTTPEVHYSGVRASRAHSLCWTLQIHHRDGSCFCALPVPWIHCENCRTSWLEQVRAPQNLWGKSRQVLLRAGRQYPSERTAKKNFYQTWKLNWYIFRSLRGKPPRAEKFPRVSPQFRGEQPDTSVTPFLTLFALFWRAVEAGLSDMKANTRTICNLLTFASRMLWIYFASCQNIPEWKGNWTWKYFVQGQVCFWFRPFRRALRFMKGLACSEWKNCFFWPPATCFWVQSENASRTLTKLSSIVPRLPWVAKYRSFKNPNFHISFDMKSYFHQISHFLQICPRESARLTSTWTVIWWVRFPNWGRAFSFFLRCLWKRSRWCFTSNETFALPPK